MATDREAQVRTWRNINHAHNGSHILLFAREHKFYELGTAPYLVLRTGQ